MSGEVFQEKEGTNYTHDAGRLESATHIITKNYAGTNYVRLIKATGGGGSDFPYTLPLTLG